jgi:macrolide transport system ATP-binding/permease protein
MMRDQDDLIIIPINTAMFRVFGETYINDIYVELSSAEVTDYVKKNLLNTLMARHKVPSGQESMFEVMDFSEMRDAMMSTADTMNMLLGTVAAISLIVGGIGVMNIMLVSVKERTKEIGLRKAIGGRRKDILMQFLIEAVIMTFTGGMAGIILGVSISLFFSLIAGWAIKISLLSIFGASFFSVVIGIGFGIWPAIQASKLSPIEALRAD